MSKTPAQGLAEAEHELLDKLRPQLHRLPFFPLYKVQLFPSSMLPLYIFESRYRDMIAACLGQGGAMAVAALLPGHESEYDGRPAVRPIAGAGIVVAHRKNQDGTYNILLRGVIRVRLADELPSARTFREAQAVLLPDELPVGHEVDATREALAALVDKLAYLIPNGSESLRSLCRRDLAPGQMADMLAAALVQSSGLRQELLETPFVPTRLDLVATEVARMLSHVSHKSTSVN